MSIQKLSGVWNAALGLLIAQYGAEPIDQQLVRAFIRGPAGSTLDLYIGSDIPANLVTSRLDEVDYTLLGSRDYASWDPPLELPGGWWSAWAWSGGATGAASTGTARLEWQ